MAIDGFRISIVEAFAVGATLSATDPVTILAIFNAYKVDPKLYTVIFGESILNDAVAIVLFETAKKYYQGPTEGAKASSLTIVSLFEAVGIFLLVFFGSLFIGVAIGIATTLMLKFTHVRRFPKIESCLVILIAYASYFFSNGIGMSGWSHRLIGPKTILKSCRDCRPPLLRHHPQTLRLLQHVPADAAHH